MGAIIPALTHRIPLELEVKPCRRLEIVESLDSGIYWPHVDVWRSMTSILEFIGPFRLRSYHLNN
ncbi:hypothetical protein ACJIZ3_006087 [Penstemon smallii]|uniref:DUF2442 domain-containing protein n=1 Tax=Penstemon smallii TaxID=265156 RepID=A0ABD3S6U7_9LAMI